jgi:branched-chain amino acid transport system substrate-binding protein
VTLRTRALAVLAATTAVASACTGGGGLDRSPSPSLDPVPVKIAFFQDGSVESSNTHGQPSFLGLKLALSQAIEAGGLPVLPELVGLDTKGDPAVAAELAHRVADDPAFVAAVAAPYWSDTAEVRDILAAAGVPTLSLSGDGDPGGSWFPIVAGQRSVAAALSGYVRALRAGDGVCMAGDGTPYAKATGSLLAPALRGDLVASATVDPASTGTAAAAVDTITAAGCTTVLWTGFGTGAAEVRAALTAAGGDVLLVGSDAMKDTEFLDLAGAAAQGSVVGCACVDLSTSTNGAAQSFIHDFQADYSVPPGVFSAEGWDAGGLLLRAMRSGAATRSEMLHRLTSASPFEGLAATYAVDDRGGVSAASQVHLYRADAGRWAPLQTGSKGLPVGTDGVLAVGSCRTGAPYAYRDARDRLVGFDVEFARLISRRLGLALGWTRTSCGVGTAPVDEGRVDVLLSPAKGLVPGTPASRAFFSTRAAVVVPAARARTADPLAKVAAGDVVGVVPDGPVAAWARGRLEGTGAQLRRFHGDAQSAYRALEGGRISAVVDAEAAAWAAIEHRPRLLVGSTQEIGDDDVMVVSASATDLLAALDDALGAMLDDGAYQRLFGAYLPGATLPEAVGT